MQEITDAILSGETAALAGVAVPDHYRAVTVHKDETEMFNGLKSRTRTRASLCTSRTCRPPSWARARRSWP